MSSPGIKKPQIFLCGLVCLFPDISVQTHLTTMNTDIGIMDLTLRKSAPDRIILLSFRQPFVQRSFENILSGHTLYQFLELIKIFRHKRLIWNITERFPAKFMSGTLDHSEHECFVIIKTVPVPWHIDYIEADSADPADILILFSEEHHKAFLALCIGKSATTETQYIDKHGRSTVWHIQSIFHPVIIRFVVKTYYV